SASAVRAATCSSSSGRPASSSALATARYVRPVSRWSYPYSSAMRRDNVPLPAAAGPSMAMIMGGLLFLPAIPVDELGHRQRIRHCRLLLQPLNDPALVGSVAVLADLPLAFDRGNLDLDAGNTLDLRGYEILRRIADRPGLCAAPLLSHRQRFDLGPEPC